MKGGSYEPMYLRFPDYTQEETLQILNLDFMTTERNINVEDDDGNQKGTVILDDTFFTRYGDLIYSIFNHNCKDLNELRYFSALLLPLYIKPIQEGTGNIRCGV
jgi:origin recognition complex subunit 5